MTFTPDQQKAMTTLITLRDKGVTFKDLSTWSGLTEGILRYAICEGKITQKNAVAINDIEVDPPEREVSLDEKVREEWPHIYSIMGNPVATLWRLYTGLSKQDGSRYAIDSIYRAASQNGFPCPESL